MATTMNPVLLESREFATPLSCCIRRCRSFSAHSTLSLSLRLERLPALLLSRRTQKTQPRRFLEAAYVLETEDQPIRSRSWLSK